MKIIFFYFKHCVLTISIWHLPTCRTEIGGFHSRKCLFWTQFFFYDHSVSHRGCLHLSFWKFIEFFENISYCHLTSPGAVWFCFSQGRFFQGKTYLGVPYWFSQNFLQNFFRIFFEKVPLGIEKKYNERKIWKKKFEKKNCLIKKFRDIYGLHNRNLFLKILKKKIRFFSFGTPR